MNRRVANAYDDLSILTLGDDLRAVFHDQNHMLLLCTPGTVLVGEVGESCVRAEQWKTKQPLTSVEAVQPSGKIQLLGLLP
jgi:hypothetical protein